MKKKKRAARAHSGRSVLPQKKKREGLGSLCFGEGGGKKGANCFIGLPYSFLY